MTTPAERFRFFLGGHDLEMLVIRDLVLDTLGPDAVADKGLGWGAKRSAYEAEIAEAAAAGFVPVLVELTDDMALAPPFIDIDHHGARAGGPSSLRQTFDLLPLAPEQWTRRFALVEANDIGHIAGMQAIGASADDMSAIRAADRRAQGITPAEEAAGLAALARAETALDGTVLVVHAPHDRTATVADPKAIAGDQRDLLIIGPTGVHFFGAGNRVQALVATWPKGWSGGDMPRTGYFGHPQPVSPEDMIKVLAAVRR
jgi:hypothetical protein